MAIYPCPIPKVSEEFKDVFDQPPHKEIQFTSDGYAVVTLAGLDQLKQYDTTIPSGVYAGKMWRRKEGDIDYLCWFQDAPDHEGKCEVKFRKILSKEAFDLLNPSGEGNE